MSEDLVGLVPLKPADAIQLAEAFLEKRKKDIEEEKAKFIKRQVATKVNVQEYKRYWLFGPVEKKTTTTPGKTLEEAEKAWVTTDSLSWRSPKHYAENTGGKWASDAKEIISAAKLAHEQGAERVYISITVLHVLQTYYD